MDFEMLFDIAFDQVVEDRLYDAGVAVLKTDTDDAAVFRVFDDQAFGVCNDRSSVNAIGATAQFGEQLFWSDQIRDFTGEVEAGENLDFRVDDGFAPGVG